MPNDRRFEGYLTPEGLYILDTFTGDLKFVDNGWLKPTQVIPQPIKQKEND